MTLQERLAILVRLGTYLRSNDDEFLIALQKRTEFNNGWFTLANQQAAIAAIAEAFLAEEPLRQWVAAYPIDPERPPQRTIGMVLAGNIPLVGFHDVLCVFVAGQRAKIKLSSKDPYVFPYLLKLLEKWDARTATYFELTEKLGGFDAVIATGSNNSARYFTAYFGKYPHIIRKNRNAVAVLSGQETATELRALGRDVFRYFGLGCRNVSKLYVPQDYELQPLLEILHEWKDIQNHTKWKNNFDYNYALTTLNKESFHLTGPLILLEEPAIPSRIATLHFERYETQAALVQQLQEQSEAIQLIVAQPDFLPLPTFPFGAAQEPGLADYADGVDTLAFLTGLEQSGQSA